MADTKPKSTGAGRRTSASKSGGTKARAKPKSTRSASSTRSTSASARSSTSASRTTGRSSSAKKPAASGRTTSSSNGRAKSSSNGTKRSSAASRSSAPARTTANRNGNGSGDGHGIVGSVKQAATKAKGPAIAVGAAAAGIAGGIALKGRGRRKTVLGVPMPKHLPSVDAKSLAKSVGEASAQFAKTSKSVSKDIERAGDQAERLGKILK